MPQDATLTALPQPGLRDRKIDEGTRSARDGERALCNPDGTPLVDVVEALLCANRPGDRGTTLFAPDHLRAAAICRPRP